MKVTMSFSGNLGYGPDQVTGMTLGELLAVVTEAVEDYGDDAEVVLLQANQQYGARYGALSRSYTFAESETH